MDTNTMYIEHYVDLHNYISDNIYELDNEIIYTEGKVAEFFTKVGETISNAWYAFIEWIFGFFKNGKDKKMNEALLKKRDKEIEELNKKIANLTKDLEYETKQHEYYKQRGDKKEEYYSNFTRDLNEQLYKQRTKAEETRKDLYEAWDQRHKLFDENLEQSKEIAKLKYDLEKLEKTLETKENEIKFEQQQKADLQGKLDKEEKLKESENSGIITSMSNLVKLQLKNLNDIVKRNQTEYSILNNDSEADSQYRKGASLGFIKHQNYIDNISISKLSIEKIEEKLELAKVSLKLWNALYILMINRYSSLKNKRNRWLGQLYNDLIEYSNGQEVNSNYSDFKFFYYNIFESIYKKNKNKFYSISYEKYTSSTSPVYMYEFEKDIPKHINTFIEYVKKYNKFSSREIKKDLKLKFDHQYSFNVDKDIDKTNYEIIKNNLYYIGNVIFAFEKAIRNKINKTYDSNYIKISKELVKLIQTYPALSPDKSIYNKIKE